MTIKVGFTQLYLHTTNTETFPLHTSWTIKKHETMWSMKQEPHLPPLLERLQKPGDRCLLLSTGVFDSIHMAHFSIFFCKTYRPKGIKSLTHDSPVQKLLGNPEYMLSGSEHPSHSQPLKSEDQLTHRADIHNSGNPEVTSKRPGHTLLLF